jgi:hypothetical protein
VCKMLILYSSLRIKKHNTLKSLSPEFLIQGHSCLRQYINQRCTEVRNRGFGKILFKGVYEVARKSMGWAWGDPLFFGFMAFL